jgi:diacylglycerol kinase family enzyme
MTQLIFMRLCTAKLLHNPGAGYLEHHASELVTMIRKAGIECSYMPGAEEAFGSDGECDFYIVAGGDGTIKKTVLHMFRRGGNKKPIAVLPLGTANNIAKALKLHGSHTRIISQLPNAVGTPYDLGVISNVAGFDYFLEGIGYGIFPFLMLEMARVEPGAVKRRGRNQKALQLMKKIIENYRKHECRLVVDGVDRSGEFMLVEIMNIPAIGPNLVLAGDANPGDGLLDVVVLRGDDRENFAGYIERRLKGENDPFPFSVIRGRDITMSWSGEHVHIDDEVIKIPRGHEVRAQLQPAALEFLVV